MNSKPGSSDLSRIRTSPDGTHHILDGKPLYSARFLSVMNYHEPGAAAVQGREGWFHIGLSGEPLYGRRFKIAFGFYQGVAAVDDDSGFFHVGLDGRAIYDRRYAWAGNFQEGRAAVKDLRGNHYHHITSSGERAYDMDYRYAGDFKNGVAVVYDDAGFAHYIDASGRDLRAGRLLRYLLPLHKGLAVAQDSGGFFHTEGRGRSAYQERYAWVEPYYNGLALVQAFDGRLGTIDVKGRWVHTVREAGELIDPPSFNRVTEDLVAFWRVQTIHAASELGIFERVRRLKGGGSAMRLSRETRIARERLERLLDALVVMGYLRRTDRSSFELAQAGTILCEELRHAPSMWAEEQYIAFSGLAWSLRNGRNYFEERFGKSFFDYMQEDSERLSNYQLATHEYAVKDYARVPDVEDFSRHESVMDIGGGTGALLNYILEKNPGLKGILFESDKVIDIARRELNKRRTRFRLQLVKGDFFEQIPGLADAMILSRVLHDWDDDSALAILTNVRKSLPPAGTVYVIEILKPERPTEDIGVSLDLNMLCVTGGRERREREYRKLLTRAGFSVSRIAPLGYLSMIVAMKRRGEPRLIAD